ncbi:MAG: mercury methylation ferredoxin HgcB [Pseudomonadota bacterium]
MLYLRDVVSLTLDRERCTGCRMCTRVCPHAVFTVDDGKALIVQRDACMECGACARNCEAGALAVTAGVGCAAAVVNGLLGRSGGDCCCVVDGDGSPRTSSDCC